MASWETSLKSPMNYAVYFEYKLLNTFGRGRFDPVDVCAKRMKNVEATPTLNVQEG